MHGMQAIMVLNAVGRGAVFLSRTSQKVASSSGSNNKQESRVAKTGFWEGLSTGRTAVKRLIRELGGVGQQETHP